MPTMNRSTKKTAKQQAPARLTMKGKSVLAASDETGEPKTEIRLFRIGKNETTKGVFTLTAENAQAIVQAFQTYGNDLKIDYDHDTFNEQKAGPKPAAGWIRQGGLEARADGLWAKVEWTDKAREMIKAKEYRYFSPAFVYDKATGEIVPSVSGLDPLALENWPGTLDMEPLLARAVASAVDKRSADRIQLASFGAITEALWKCICARYGYDAFILDVFDDDVVFCYCGRTYSCEYTMDGSAAVLTDDPIEVERTYTPIAPGGSGTGMPGESEDDESGDTQSPERVTVNAMAGGRTLKEALGVADTATEAQLLGAVDRLGEIERVAVVVTGKRTPKEIGEVLAAWKKSDEENASLRAQLSAEKKRNDDTERASIFAKLTAEKRITPAQIEDFKEAPIEEVRRFAKSAPVIANLAAPATREPSGGAIQGGSVTVTTTDPVRLNGKTWTELSFMERDRMYRDDPELYKAMRDSDPKRMRKAS